MTYRYWVKDCNEIQEVEDLPYPFFRLNSNYFRTSVINDLITVTKPDHQELVISGRDEKIAVKKFNFLLETQHYIR